MILGNVIYSGELVNHDVVDYINYFDVKNQIDLSSLADLPTLIVGYNNFKNFFSDKFPNQSILEKEVILNKLYWEFSFLENKKQHVNGVAKFVDNDAINYYFTDFKYLNIDPVIYNIHSIEQLTKMFESIASSYMDNRMIYLVSSKIVYGIDLISYAFYGLDVDSIKNYIAVNSIKQVVDITNEAYLRYYKSFPNFEFLKRYIPLFELVR